jgi:hypothetical protein
MARRGSPRGVVIVLMPVVLLAPAARASFTHPSCVGTGLGQEATPVRYFTRSGGPSTSRCLPILRRRGYLRRASPTNGAR